MPELTEKMLHCVYNADVNGMKKLLASGETIDAVDGDGRSALMHAVLATPAVAAVVATLVQCGTNVNAKDGGQSWTSLAFAARDCSAEICQILIDAGAEIDAIDVFGNTPLWRAVMARKTENVRSEER